MHRNKKIIEWFLRIAISAGFLSAVADRFGLWPQANSAWGNWDAFVKYTNTLMPFADVWIAEVMGAIATALEVILAILLLTRFKTSLIAKLSGILLICFGICMAIFNHPKAPLDYSVFTAAAAAFALSFITDKSERKL